MMKPETIIIILLSALLGVNGFIASKVWSMESRLTVVETKMKIESVVNR